MSELFSIKKVNLKKASIFGIIISFGIVSFLSGWQANSYAASSSSVLPVVRGGTGQNNLANVMGVGSADKLETSRKINNAYFNGSQDIYISGWNQISYTKYPTTYIKFSLSQETELPIVVIDFAASHNIATQHLGQVVITGENVSIAKLYIAAGNNTVTYYLASDGNLYFRLTGVEPVSRQFYYCATFSGNIVNEVTAASEIANLNNQTFLDFDK
ncbi:MAG: hypothetical protein LBT91_00735 [Bifidobacteriaceae bacterium]|jgi:hypothetical protein|nr:hypothetical protein [Bifidobacteriaceae bacterium]